MKRLFPPLLIVLFSVFVLACSSNANETNNNQSENSNPENKENTFAKDTNKTTAEIKVIYFHATRRCATCNAIEKVCSEFLQKTYGDQIRFTSVNYEDDMNPLVTRYNVSSQALYVIQGSHKEDLTGTAFMNAKSRPEKLEEELKTTIDKML